MNDQDLLPCPFCKGSPKGPHKEGGSDERLGYNFIMRVACTMCGATMIGKSAQNKNGWCIDSGEAKRAVIAAWNRRTTSQAPGAVVVEALRKTQLALLRLASRDGWEYQTWYAEPQSQDGWMPAEEQARRAISAARAALSAGDAAPQPAGDAPDYRAMFGAAIGQLAEISAALGIDEEEAACANGNHLILAEIERQDRTAARAAQAQGGTHA